ADELEAQLAGEPELALAADNGPRAAVAAGARAALERLEARLAPELERRWLRLSHAFHSPLVEPMLDAFGAIAAELDYAAPQIPVVSNVHGRIATPAELADPRYWVRHVRASVRFGAGVEALAGAGAERFVELGP